MKSQTKRDIIAVFGIILGVIGIYAMSPHGNASLQDVAPPSDSQVAPSTQESDSASSQAPSTTMPFALASSQSSPIAPDFTLTAMDGSQVKLSEAVKQGPVLLDFWATWCEYCRYELPQLSDMYDSYKGKGVQIYAINNDADEAGLQRFFSKEHPDCPVLIDTGQTVSAQYDVSSLPALFLIDKQMRVRSELAGADPNTKQDLGKSLDALLQGA